MAQEHLRQLNARGLDVYVPEDFDEVPALVAATGREKSTPMLDLHRNDFLRSNAFWLFLMQGDDCVGGCAARYYDLAGESLENYLRRTSQAQYNRETDPIKSVARPTDRISGRLIYMGDLQINPAARSNVTVRSAFFQLAQALAVLEWDFDWIYAFVDYQHRRLVPDYGFNYYVTDAITWHDPIPEGRRNDHVLVAIDFESFSHFW
ncbi:hypothetical protein [Candidatus Rhodobacter oscarellae]|nr:hypothetical protein [Candidatus Rhodobacter lobularis]